MKTYLEKIILIKANWLLNIYPEVTEVPFDELSFLQEREAVTTSKGVREYKSRYYKNKEVLRICYLKHFATYKDIENVFIGTSKKILYYDENGNVVKQKKKDLYKFSLDPVNDLQSNIVGYTSLKGEKILKNERSLAELKLKSQNPIMYNIVYTAYKSLIEDWKATGDSTALISAIDNETGTTLLEVFSKVVEGTVDTTVKDYIKHVIS